MKTSNSSLDNASYKDAQVTSSDDEESLEEKPDQEEDEDDQDKDDESLIQTARNRFRLAQEAEQEIRKLALEDLQFRAGKQWPDQIQAQRDMDGRPCLVINRIPQFVQQVTNDQRQNRPSIKVHPVDDKADVETAKMIQGLIRHIEYNSSADMAYDTAFESAVLGGFGYFRVVTEYSDPTSFDQEIIIKRIRNPLSVYFDPYSELPDGSDAKWAQIVEDMTAEVFKEQYPDSKLSKMTDWESTGLTAPGWMTKDSCRIAEYFYIEEQNHKVFLLNNGDVIEEDDLKNIQLTPEISVVKSRMAKVPVVKWCKHNGIEILERTTFPGSYIPIIPVYGAEIYVDGRRILEGIIRNAKDSQRMYNYWASAETEAIALTPRAPFIVAEGQLEGYEGQWREANRRNHAYLQYKPQSVGGAQVPAPGRNAFEPAVQAITQARMMASEDLKATTGIYDASLGAQSNETSGIAIQRRNTQAQTSNFHFMDNLTRSLKHLGCVLIDIIPYVYDAPRTARIIGEDGEQKIVRINEPYMDTKTGKPALYRMDTGRYDVTVDVGPSFASKRQEAVASMLDLSRSNPAITQIAGDLMVKNMDWPGASEIADRLKKMLPPQLQDQANGQAVVPPQVQAQMQQMNQILGQLTKELNDAHDVIDQKRVEIESKERIEMKKLEVESAIQLAKLQSNEAIELLGHQIAEIDKRTKLLGFEEPIPDEAAQFELPQSQGQPMSQPGALGAGGPQGEPQEPMPTGGQSPGQPMEPEGPMQ